MNSIDIWMLLSSLVGLLFTVLSYKELTFRKSFDFSFNKILSFVVILFCIILNKNYNITIFQAPLAFALLILANAVMFKDSVNILVNTTVLNYIIAVICEIVISILVVNFNIIDINVFQSNSLLVFLFTVLSSVPSYLICKYVPLFKNLLLKFNKCTDNSKYKIFLIMVFLIVMLLIDFRGVEKFDYSTYIINIILVILIMILFIAYLNDEIKIKREVKEIDILLDSISKYENIIDENRVNNHELLNNLLLLKSIENKNTKRFEKILDELIATYDKNSNIIKNIGILPKGIKGIIYYKFYDLQKENVEISINISKQVSSYLKKISSFDYITLCKVIPILLDNSIEAIKNCKRKFILFDVYKEHNKIIILIENPTSENINLDNINDKYYSSKGVNRGLGLYIVAKLLSKTDNIELIRSCNNEIFSSKLIIKK